MYSLLGSGAGARSLNPSPPALARTMAFFYPYYHIITIFGMILLLMAAPFHFNTQGASVWPFILWLFILCLLNTINGIVWRNHMDNIAPTWCDLC